MTAVPWAATHLDRRTASIIDVATDSLGLYVSPPVSHLELAARIPDYRPGHLERLMDERRLIGLRTLRGSSFLMPVELLPIVVPATRDRNVRAFGSYLRKNLRSAPYEVWVDRVLDVVGPGEALTKREITDRLDPPESERPLMTNLISQVATEGHFVGVRVPASWRSAQIAYTRWADWLPDVDIESPDPEHARTRLAALYLESFGPATIDDFAWWSGLTKSQARIAIESTAATGADGWFDIESEPSEPPSGVRLLPIWDTLFVTWKDRSRFLPDGRLPFIYDSSGNATSVVLLGGAVVGVWAMSQPTTNLEVHVASFQKLSSEDWDAIDAECQLLGAMAGAAAVTMVRVSEPPPNLKQGKRNLFMRPV